MSIGYPKVDFSVICYLFLSSIPLVAPTFKTVILKNAKQTKTQTNKTTCSNLPRSQNKLHSASKGKSILSSPNEAVEF